MERRRKLIDRIGRVGVWTFALDAAPAQAARQFVAEVERLGFRALWIPEGLRSKEIFTHASLLLSAGGRLVIATGIANIWARDPVAMANGAHALADAYPGRFLLGIGVSHRESVVRRGHSYLRPVARMRAYLEAMEAARYAGPEPELPAPRVLAALGPAMLRLSAEKALGAHPYFVPVEHTVTARGVLGAHAVLLPEQAVVLKRDPNEARRIAREHMAGYLGLENYANNLRRLGWEEDDLVGGGSDGLVDALVAWGDVEAIVQRVSAHLEAGADHVSVQVLRADQGLPIEELRELRPALARLEGHGLS